MTYFTNFYYIYVITIILDPGHKKENLTILIDYYDHCVGRPQSNF